MDLAASIQAVTEEIVLRLARSIAKDGGEKNLTPEDAFRSFMGTNLDFLAIGNCILKKATRIQD